MHSQLRHIISHYVSAQKWTEVDQMGQSGLNRIE